MKMVNAAVTIEDVNGDLGGGRLRSASLPR